jgi:hypothetical protein
MTMLDFGTPIGNGEPGRQNDRDGRSRTVYLSDGKVVRLEARDPFGHWHIVYSKGSLPDELSGSYTSAEQALQGLQKYISKQYDTKIVEEQVILPVLETKKVRVG